MQRTETLQATLVQMIESQSKLVANARLFAPDLTAASPSGAAAGVPPPPYVTPTPPPAPYPSAGRPLPPSTPAAAAPAHGDLATPRHRANMLGLAVDVH